MTAKKQANSTPKIKRIRKTVPTSQAEAEKFRKAPEQPLMQTPTANLLRELRIADDLAGGKGLLNLSARLQMYIRNAIKALEAAEKTLDTNAAMQGWLAGRWYGKQWVPIGRQLHRTRELANDEAWQFLLNQHLTSREKARDEFATMEAKFIKVFEQ